MLTIDARCLLEPEGSGVARYTERMIRALAADPTHPELTLLTTGSTDQNLGQRFAISQQHVRIPNQLLNSASVLRLPVSSVTMHVRGVFWQPNPMFFPCVDVPRIITIHDVSFTHFPIFFPRHTRLWYLRWVKQLLVRSPEKTYLAAVSDWTMRDLLERYPHWSGRIFVQHQPPPNIELKRDGVPAQKRIIFVSTLEPRKNADALVPMMVRLQQAVPDATLELVGRPTTWWRARARAFPSSVVLHGYVSDAARADLLRRAWACVYPSWYEGYALPPLEAMAFGIPVVCSHAAAVPEAVGGAAITVDPYRAVEEVAEALRALAKDDHLYQQHASMGIARIRELHQSFTLEPFLRVCRNLVSA